jgi:hypothetical protein
VWCEGLDAALGIYDLAALLSRPRSGDAPPNSPSGHSLEPGTLGFVCTWSEHQEGFPDRVAYRSGSEYVSSLSGV